MNINVLEDEYHFVLSCPTYRSVRIEFYIYSTILGQIGTS